MGISGLLRVVKEAQTPVHISEFRGKTLGIDGYVWLYKGAFSCSQEIALGIPTKRYIQYTLNKIKMMKHFDVSCYFVFDGGPLPSKKCTEIERESSRKINLDQGLDHHKRGNKKEAFNCFQKSLNVTPFLAKQLIMELQKSQIKFVVAPYEADAQLAYLERVGLIDGIISEDSDLIVYGCKKVIYKLDDKGNGILFDRTNMGLTRAISLKGWDDGLFRRMCILSGCDYLPAVHGIGIKRAYKYLTRSKNIQKVIQMMRAEGLNVPQNYYDEFQRAEKTFLYQKVYDPTEKKLVTLEEIQPEHENDDLLFLGELFDDNLAYQIAIGEMDPITMKPFGSNCSSTEIITLSSNIKPVEKRLLNHWFKPSKEKTDIAIESVLKRKAVIKESSFAGNFKSDTDEIKDSIDLRQSKTVINQVDFVATSTTSPHFNKDFMSPFKIGTKTRKTATRSRGGDIRDTSNEFGPSFRITKEPHRSTGDLFGLHHNTSVTPTQASRKVDYNSEISPLFTLGKSPFT